MTTRPPIVTVLGHVDHGKTTLLDTIRSSNIAAREAGGITQGIGATKISTKFGNVTFIDTPGHAVFNKMRSRGAALADVVILVVAADDGVMPQTKEAIEYIREQEVPLIVAITKTDLKNANVEKAIGSLETEGILFEGRGGDTPYVQISAKENKGLDELLELIQLVAEVNEIKGDPEGDFEAIVIETNKEKRGAVASVVVRNGTLKIGIEITDGNSATKVRGIFNEQDKPVKEVLPGNPALILGFNDLPEVGSILKKLNGEGLKEKIESSGKKKIKIEEDEVAIVLKAKSAGSLEALILSLPQKVIVIQSGVGDVTDSDVFFAKSANALIIVFESKTPNSVKKLAETEAVSIHEFKIIYELIKFLEDQLSEKTEEILGKAEVVADFPFNKRRIAGCKVKEGAISKSNRLLVTRGGEILGEAKILSIRRQKDEVDVAKAGEECGILFNPPFDFQVGDMLLSAK